MAKPKKNEIWVTRTSAGYCLTYKNLTHQTGGYLDPDDHLSTKATYFSFPKAVQAVTQLSSDFYSHGVNVIFDRHRRAKIPKPESTALRWVVRELESLAIKAKSANNKVRDALEVLNRE